MLEQGKDGWEVGEANARRLDGVEGKGETGYPTLVLVKSQKAVKGGMADGRTQQVRFQRPIQGCSLYISFSMLMRATRP